MKQRILATFMCLCLVLGLMPTVALAEESPASETQGESSEQQATATDSTHVSTTDILSGNSTDGTMSGTCGATEQDNVRWTLNKNGETVTIDGEPKDAYTLTISGTGAMADISYNWTDVDTAPWAQFRSQITRIVIDEGITSIGKYAFIKTSIRDLDLSVCSSLTCISERAFSNIGTDFVSVTFPESLEEIGEAAFSGAGFTEVDLTKCKILHTLGDEAFGYCSNLKSVNILECESLREIGRSCFYSCKKLEDIKLPNSITSIKDAAFTDTGLTKVNWNNLTNLENIAGQVFSKNNNLSVVSLSGCSSLRTIGQYLFLGSSNVITVDLTGCTSLTQVEYPHEFDNVAKNCVVYSEIPLKLPSKTIGAITDGGTFAEDTTFTAGTLATPTKDGAIFEGWYNNEQCSGTSVIAPTAGQTYYAKWIDLGLTDISLQYQGTQTVPTDSGGVTYSDWQPEDSSIVSIENGQIKANKVGETTITATATYNGNTAEVSVPVEVIPRVLTYTLTGGDTGSGSITYNYSGGHHALADSLTFQWKDNPDTKVTLREGTDINYTYAVSSENGGDGTARTYDYLPMPVDTYNDVKFNLLNENYTFALSGGESTGKTLEIDVVVQTEGSLRAYLASAAPKADQNFVYTGQGVLPVEGTLNAYKEDSTSSDTVDIGTFTINIEGLNGTSFHEEVSGIESGTNLSAISGLALPTKPGTYIITASAANDSYYLYKSLVFTISKATVTVKADDKSVYVADEMPEWTYTVSGLASGDSLSGTVSLSCEATNTNTTGTYTITPSGAAVPDTNHYNNEIVYQPGTLTILSRGGGGGGGSSSGGSSSSNVSGSGDNVTITASGGSVTAPQMESAVNKADEGATITIKATSSTTVSLPVGGMADAADNDNDVLLDLRYGEVTLTARTIAGLTDGVSSSGKIKVSITSQTSSKDETISDLLDKGAAVFDVSVTINDVEVHSFDGTLTLTFTVSNLSKITDPHILHILTDGTKEYYAPDSISGNTITVKGVRNLSTFAVIPGSEVPEEQTNPFTDVYESDYYYDAVLWAVANGVTNGTSATTFGPNVTVTRAQMVTFLWRAHGSPEATGANPFTDVGTSDYYYDAVLWAVANGVTTGTSATTFSPDAPVTRAQAVTFQWRAAGSPVVSGSSFDDVAADAYYVNAVTWAVANGITNGTGGNNFSPDAAVSRAQAVTFLWRELA